MAPKVQRFFSDDIELSPEATNVVTQVRGTMENWIDDKVEQLTVEINAAIQEAGEKLQTEVEAVEAEFKEARESVDNMLQKIDQLSIDLDAGDGQTIQEAIKVTKEQVEAVRSELKARERKWKTAGATIVSTAMKAAGAVTGIPIPG